MSSELWDVIKSLQSRISELETVLDNLISFGKVAEVDYQKGLVAIDDGAGIISPLAPWVGNKTQGASEWNPPEVGQSAMMLSAKNQSFMLMGGFSDDTPAKSNSAAVTRKDWEDGAYVSYDRASGILDIHIVTAAEVNISSTNWKGDVTIDGDLNITKGLTVGESISFGAAAKAKGAKSAAYQMGGIGNIDINGSIDTGGDITSAKNVKAKSFIET